MRNLLLSAFFAVLTAVGGVLAIPVPLVPFTMQTFFVLMSGLFLGPKYGPLSQVIYIMMGLAGAPVLAGGAGGLQHVFSPTFGFLVAFVPVSWAAGFLARDNSAALYIKYVLICLAATVMLYLIGLPSFYFNMRYVLKTPVTIAEALKIALLPFIVPDLIKAVVAGGLACKAIPVLRDAGLLESHESESKRTWY